ncbi:hypothetical protein HanHA300_Chr14g0517901 [Helianthus annuus]|nr:hypothetical protein HanHA300_Chr14g0517901 [Helianthus annuus]KAJ0467805.1 hypothetical protein HanIR_Chr14g0689361 [Helianthus annuus]
MQYYLECKKELPWYLACISSHVHLAVLGILGVMFKLLLLVVDPGTFSYGFTFFVDQSFTTIC